MTGCKTVTCDIWLNMRALNVIFGATQLVLPSVSDWTDSKLSWQLLGYGVNLFHSFSNRNCPPHRLTHFNSYSTVLSTLSLFLSNSIYFFCYSSELLRGEKPIIFTDPEIYFSQKLKERHMMRTTEEIMAGEINDTLLPSTEDDIKRFSMISLSTVLCSKKREFWLCWSLIDMNHDQFHAI